METDLPAQVSAPGRFMLFGEHALNFGHPAVAVAVDLRVRCNAQLSQRFTVNGEPMEAGKHPFARAAVIHGWTDMDKPLALTISSDIPPELGLGENGATAVACLGAISMIHDHIIFEQVARNSYESICEVGEACNPLDTSVSTCGGGIMADPKPGENALWTFQKDARTWQVRDIPVTGMDFVLGYSGTPSAENGMDTRIKRFCERNSFAREIIDDMEQVCREGCAAMRRHDREKVGELMNLNHRLLSNLGVGTPTLQKMTQAASRHSFGVKITGAGGGGCIVALARDPEKAAKAIEDAGGKAFILQLASEGVRPED
ncbi:MAG: mevalonate kinase [Thermoplasmata archaeon]|nr:mevalonate kinase [Thermoplasmata archaeon]